jgi:hypothetical protein
VFPVLNDAGLFVIDPHCLPAVVWSLKEGGVLTTSEGSTPSEYSLSSHAGLDPERNVGLESTSSLVLRLADTVTDKESLVLTVVVGIKNDRLSISVLVTLDVDCEVGSDKWIEVVSSTMSIVPSLVLGHLLSSSNHNSCTSVVVALNN